MIRHICQWIAARFHSHPIEVQRALDNETDDEKALREHQQHTERYDANWSAWEKKRFDVV